MPVSDVNMQSVLFANLLLAHLLGDFFLQTNKQVQEKRALGFKSSALYLHSLIVAVISWLFVFDLDFWWFAGIVFLTHAIIDRVKVVARKGLYAFVVDQAAHVIILFLIAKYYQEADPEWIQFSWISHGYELAVPAILSAVAFCISPANFLIRETLDQFKIDTSPRGQKAEDDHSTARLKNAGALIGSMERLLVLLFVLIGNFEAAGLTFAAKSILRFKDDEGPRTECVLVGTLLSFLLAVLAAVLVLMFVFDYKGLKG